MPAPCGTMDSPRKELARRSETCFQFYPLHILSPQYPLGETQTTRKQKQIPIASF